MSTIKTDPFTTTLPFFGECTLLPHFEDIPQQYRTYASQHEVAKLLKLKEFPEIAPRQIQEIFKCLAHCFSEHHKAEGSEIRVLLSGTHFAYPSIDVRNREQKPEPCVTALVICFWNRKNMFDANQPDSKHFEMFLDEVPIGEIQDVQSPDLLFSIFLGIPTTDGEAIPVLKL